MSAPFEEVITTRERLRELMGPVMSRSALKVIDHIDPICRRYIAASPFLILATHGADGRLDLSPKGDPAGFVVVLDDHTLAIPDRPGNGRLDSFENLLVRPEVALFFVVPGHGDTLRVSGKGRIVRDGSLAARMAVNGKLPKLVLVIEVEEAFLHCPKCTIRSRMWKPEEWPDRSNVPTIADALVAHTGLGETLAAMQAHVEKSNTEQLY